MKRRLSVVGQHDPIEIAEKIVRDHTEEGLRECELIVRYQPYGMTRAKVRKILREKVPKDKIKVADSRPRPKVAPLPSPLAEPPAIIVTAPAAAAVKPKPVAGRTFGQIVWGLVAIGIGIVLGGTGIVLNCQYWYAAGGSNPLVSLIFCTIGGTVDSITIAIPSWAAELWKRRSYVLSVLVAIFFIPAASVSLIASAGFSGTNIGDANQARADTKTSKEDLGAILAQKKIERASLKINDLPEVIEIQIQDERGRIPRDNLRSSKDCTDTTYSSPACSVLKQLRADKAKAERRIVLDAEIKRDTAVWEAMPSISSRNPAAERASQITGGLIRPEIIESYLINAMAAAPILAGLFFAIGTALLR